MEGMLLKTKHQFVITAEYIAEAQRLSIAQNKTLKFFYQTWWAWWLPRPVLLVLGIYCFLEHQISSATVLGALLVFSCFGQWWGQRSLAKAREKVRTKGTTSIVTMSEQGIELSGANGASQLKWRAMLPPAVFPNGVLLKFSRLSMLWLPDSALVEGSAADVRHLVSANIDSASHQ